jgi:hypothetical protein
MKDINSPEHSIKGKSREPPYQLLLVEVTNVPVSFNVT